MNTNNTEKIKLYKDIFGAAPWNEGYTCGNCEKILPKDFYGRCECGEIDRFRPFYNNKDLKNTLELVQATRGYTETILEIAGRTTGFAWGWETDILGLNNQKLGLSDRDILLLRENIMSKFDDFDFDQFYYFAEIGLIATRKGAGYASQMFEKNLETAKNNGNTYALLRTTKKSDVPYLWFKREGFEDVYEYQDEQDRVILVKKLLGK